jgi:hypothetical protein
MDYRELSAPTLDGLIEKLQLRLNVHATAATREWWTKYLRGAASFRGVKMADVREAVHAWFRQERLGEYLSVGQQKELALMLLKVDYSEDKLAGILFFKRSSCRHAHWTGAPICPASRASLSRGISVTGAPVTGSASRCSGHW